MTIPLSILDLATVWEGSTPSDTLRASVETAQHAEAWGYRRYWFAEHHNMPTILSSAPAVLIAHVAAHTSTINVGSGGVMLPNHSPLIIAEQFGTLHTLHPGRIDLGVGRAPGGDQETFRALRRDPSAAEYFPQDVAELRRLLGPRQPDQHVQAIPGTDTNVPVFVLGSSMFGARLAAAMGLPYSFASHFAPAAMDDALAAYRQQFQPSDQLAQPYVIAAMNVFAADTAEQAEELYADNVRRMAQSLAGRTASIPDSIDDATLLASPLGQQVRSMLTHSAVGDAEQVVPAVQGFVERTAADEIMVVSNIVDAKARLRSYHLLADAWTR